MIGSAFLNIILFGFSSTPKQIPLVAPKTIKVAKITRSFTPPPTLSPTPELRSDLNSSSTQGRTLVSQKQNTPNLLQQINDFRVQNGKSPVAPEQITCAFATLRASEITTSFNHDGFENRVNSHSLPYSSYTSVAENIAFNSDSGQIVPGWINSPGHRENLLRDVPYGCVGSSGIYFVYEAWKP